MDSVPAGRRELPRLLLAFAVLVAATSSMEALWYLGIARDEYSAQIGTLMNAQFDVFVAVLFYLCYSLGAIVFSLRPALAAGSWRSALVGGALYGFFCYSAHNLTDLADVKGYSARIAALDIAWGTCMTAVACGLSYLVVARVAPHPDPLPVGERESS